MLNSLQKVNSTQESSETSDISRLFADKSPNAASNQLWNQYLTEMKSQENYLKESIEIQPIPSFVCKTTIKDGTASMKAFINICSHQMIGRCSEEIEPNTKQMAWRYIIFNSCV